MGINDILLNSSMYLLVYLNSLNISSETFPLRICSAPGKPAKERVHTGQKQRACVHS